MEKFISLIVSISGAFLLPLMALVMSLLLTPVMIKVLPKFGMVDHPGGRHIHQKETPRGGGLAIVIAVFAALFCGKFFAHSVDSGNFLRQLGYPALILVVLGIFDDRFSLPSLPKLLIQMVIAFLVWYLCRVEFSIGNWLIPWYLSLPITVFWVLLVVNAFNLIDGMDGLASGLAVISSFSMAVWFMLRWGVCDNSIAMLILCGACLGFLPYNFHPAKIFLGDTGSTFLGLYFAVAGLSSLDKAVTATSLILPMLVIGVPIFDVFLAVWRRSIRKLLFSSAPGIMQGDREHLHHRLLRAMHTQSKAALMMYFLSLIFSVVALVIVLCKDTAPALGYLLMVLAFLVMLRRLAKIEQFDSFTFLRKNFSSPRKGLLLSSSHAVIDMMILLIISMFSSWVLAEKFQLIYTGILIVPPVMILMLTKSYRVYWLRPGLREGLYLSWKIFIGTLIGALLLNLYLRFFNCDHQFPLKYHFLAASFYVFSSTLLISFERFLLYYAESLWYNMFVCRCRPQKMIPVMVYGAGISGRLYVRFLGCRHQGNTVRPIGLFDDDIALHGLIVYGLPVYGGIEQLENTYEKHPFERLVVTIKKITPSKQEQLLDFSRRHQVQLIKFQCQEQKF